MNYNDYQEIMQAEGLTLPEIGKYTIDEAIKCNNIIKALKAETKFDTTKQVKEMEEKKIYWILEAIEWGRFTKENRDMTLWADRLLKRMR